MRRNKPMKEWKIVYHVVYDNDTCGSSITTRGYYGYDKTDAIRDFYYRQGGRHSSCVKRIVFELVEEVKGN